jgi:elongator complex protein 1
MPLDEPQQDERCRSIERGAKIVTVMPTTYSVILQMPRGIEHEQYRDAFLACRNQRVDMNILHDHDPDRFLRNIEKTITQIKRIEHIDLLLSQLR